jgi:H+-translocating diphosphatase
MSLRARTAPGGGRSIYDLEGGGGSAGSLATMGMKPSKKSIDFTGLPTSMTLSAVLLIGLTLFLGANSEHSAVVLFVTGLVLLSAVICYQLTYFIMAKDDGTLEMKEVADAVRAGSEGFFHTQYTTIFRFSIATAIVLWAGYYNRPRVPGQSLSNATNATVTACSFLFGAFFSACSGYVGLWICVRSNVRVASAARTSYKECMRTALLAGFVPASIVIAMAVLGIAFLYCVLEQLVMEPGRMRSHPEEVPVYLVGYGFGASFVALFAQLGGGIYTKAADVGADLVGKVEQDLDEDDPRNPAVVADLVGDNVGDCAGRGADLFESIAAEIVAAMVLGGTMAKHAKLPASGFLMFPLAVHGFDLLVSAIGCAYAYYQSDATFAKREPMALLKSGYYAAMLSAASCFYLSCHWLLQVEGTRSADCFFACGLLGMFTALMVVVITQYYTDYVHYPVRSIGQAAVTGHATCIITGTAVGLESCAMPTLVVCIALLGSFHIGEASGIVDHATGLPAGGLFGTAVATMGMLSSAVYVLTMDFFGPIADNAGGIVEMGEQPEEVREITDLLDAVGNTTKAATKGFAVGSASLACFLLFSAFMDEVALFTGQPFKHVDIAVPEVFVGGMLGAALVMLFSSYAMAAVGRSAQAVVQEVRRQFAERPGIMAKTEKPNYQQCVAIVTASALREMVRPALLAISAPIIVGLTFKAVGRYTGDPAMGPKAVAGMLMFATVSGVMMSLYFNNAGGAWDNAKKLVETGAFGGKGSEAHKASITGDTVGDPFKDTAGPSLHVLIKLLSTITLVLAPMFVLTPDEISGAHPGWLGTHHHGQDSMAKGF